MISPSINELDKIIKCWFTHTTAACINNKAINNCDLFSMFNSRLITIYHREQTWCFPQVKGHMMSTCQIRGGQVVSDMTQTGRKHLFLFHQLQMSPFVPSRPKSQSFPSETGSVPVKGSLNTGLMETWDVNSYAFWNENKAVWMSNIRVRMWKNRTSCCLPWWSKL